MTVIRQDAVNRGHARTGCNFIRPAIEFLFFSLLFFFFFCEIQVTRILIKARSLDVSLLFLSFLHSFRSDSPWLENKSLRDRTDHRGWKTPLVSIVFSWIASSFFLSLLFSSLPSAGFHFEKLRVEVIAESLLLPGPLLDRVFSFFFFLFPLDRPRCCFRESMKRASPFRWTLRRFCDVSRGTDAGYLYRRSPVESPAEQFRASVSRNCVPLCELRIGSCRVSLQL